MPNQFTGELQEILSIGAIQGVDPTTSPYFVAPQHLVSSSNFLPDSVYGALTTVKGRSPLLDLPLPAPSTGTFIFNRRDPLKTVYLFAVTVGSTGHIYAGTPGQGAAVLLPLPGAGGLTPNLVTTFAAAGRWVFVTNGVDRPLKIDEFLNVTYWGIEPAADPATLTGEIGGKLSIGQAPYNYCVTFGNPTQESSQGAIAGPVILTQTPAIATVTFGGTFTTNDVLSIFVQIVDPVTGNKAVAEGQGVAIGPGTDTLLEINRAFQRQIDFTLPYELNDPNNVYTGVISVTATAVAGTVELTIVDSTGEATAANLVQFYGEVTTGTTETVTPSSPQAPQQAAVIQGSVMLTNIPVSTDPQVTERNIYRIGGGLGQWRLVHTIHDNTTTTYTDTLADTAVTGQSLTIFRDPPPPFNAICEHLDRIWGFDDSGLVWWSNLGEPWGFNSLTGNLPAGINNNGDEAVNLCSIGTVLVLFKTRTTYAVFGNTDDSFLTYKLFDIGCASRASVASAYGICYWVSRQGAYSFDGNQRLNLSDGNYQQSNIKAIMDSMTIGELNDCCGFCYGRMYGLSLVDAHGTFMYDPRSTGWWPIAWQMRSAAYDLESDIPVVGERANNDGEVVSLFTGGGQDLGDDITATATSRIFSDMQHYWLGQILAWDAPLQDASGNISLVVDGAPPIQVAQHMPFGAGLTRKRVSLPQEAAGVDWQIQLVVVSHGAFPVTINKVGVYGTPDRMLMPESVTTDS